MPAIPAPGRIGSAVAPDGTDGYPSHAARVCAPPRPRMSIDTPDPLFPARHLPYVPVDAREAQCLARLHRRIGRQSARSAAAAMAMAVVVAVVVAVAALALGKKPGSRLGLRLGLAAIAGVALIGTAHLPAAAGPAHQHGTARLTVAIDGTALTIELETPLDGVLGFEHAPRTDRHKAQVREMAQRLARGDALFVPSAGAGCVQKGYEARSAVLAPALLAGGAAQTVAAPEASGPARRAHAAEHADLEARWQFVCAHPAQLRQLEVRLFDAFRGLQRIDAEVAGPVAQSGARLSRTQRVVRW